MTLNQALDHFFASDTFAMLATKGQPHYTNLRSLKSRHNGDMLGEEAKINLLKKYGYEVRIHIVVTPPAK